MSRFEFSEGTGLNTYFEVSKLRRTLHDVVELGGKILVAQPAAWGVPASRTAAGSTARGELLRELTTERSP